MNELADKLTVLDTLRFMRHDWMNRVQILQMNLELERPERAFMMLKEYAIEAKHESLLCRLNMPLTAEYILTANWLTWPFQIGFEVLISNQAQDALHHYSFQHLDDDAFQWLQRLFATIAPLCVAGHDHELALIIMPSEGEVKLTVEFHGQMEGDSAHIAALLQSFGELEEAEQFEEEWSLLKCFNEAAAK